jgi:hypothetical protein
MSTHPSQKAQLLMREKGLRPIRVLYRDYVILCEDKAGRKVVLKTDNMDREAEIYDVLMKHFDPARWPSIDIVHFLDYSDDYIIMEFVDGVDPNQEILDGDRDVMRFSQFPLIVRGFWDLKDFLATTAAPVSAIDVEMTKPGEPTVYEWLHRKPERWSEMATKKLGAPFLLRPETRRVVEEAFAAKSMNTTLQRPLVPQFGVYGPHQMIIRDGRVVLFDFGGHLKWRPELYDAVWPLWWQLLHFKEAWLAPYRRKNLHRYIGMYADAFWWQVPEQYKKEVGRAGYDTLFTAVLVERLIGCHIDILRRDDNHLKVNPDMYVGKLSEMVDDLLVYYAGEFKHMH